VQSEPAWYLNTGSSGYWKKKKITSVSRTRNMAAAEIQGHGITTNNAIQQLFGSQQMFS